MIFQMFSFRQSWQPPLSIEESSFFLRIRDDFFGRARYSAGSNSVRCNIIHADREALCMTDEIPRHNASESEVRETRRLFYVGFTRARYEIHLMFGEFNPSQFVTEIEERRSAS